MAAKERWNDKAREGAFNAMMTQLDAETRSGWGEQIPILRPGVPPWLARKVFNWCWSFCFRMVMASYDHALADTQI